MRISSLGIILAVPFNSANALRDFATYFNIVVLSTFLGGKKGGIKGFSGLNSFVIANSKLSL